MMMVHGEEKQVLAGLVLRFFLSRLYPILNNFVL
jgi:hypothetical protein